MEKYEGSKATQLAYDEFFKCDFENIELPGKEYIDALNNIPYFTDKLIEQIQKGNRCFGFGCCKNADRLRYASAYDVFPPDRP